MKIPFKITLLAIVLGLFGKLFPLMYYMIQLMGNIE